MIYAAEIAKKKYGNFDIVLIGSDSNNEFESVPAESAEEGHKIMVEMLEKGQLDGCVTQHFDFPIGVSTVGRVIAPGRGKEMIIANTTGTSS